VKNQAIRIHPYLPYKIRRKFSNNLTSSMVLNYVEINMTSFKVSQLLAIHSKSNAMMAQWLIHGKWECYNWQRHINQLIVCILRTIATNMNLV